MAASTRAQLLRMLNKLEDRIREMQQQSAHHDASFWQAFAPLADEVRAAAGPENDEWVKDRIDAMLGFYAIKTASSAI